MKILTVCGNGIGSSLMLAMKLEEMCKEEGIEGVSVESSDFNSAQSKDVDLIVTVKEIAEQFPENREIAIIRSYTNKKKIREDVLEKIKELIKQ
jgi:PTS system ascorbate-specific IIB component